MNKGRFDDHPGHFAGSCPIRRTIHAAPYGTSSNGYGCGWTGGHCLPGKLCKSRVEKHAAETKARREAEIEIFGYSRKF